MLHHMLAGDPVEQVAGRLELAVETGAGTVRVRLRWPSELGPGVLERHPLDDPSLVAGCGPVVHRLLLDVTARASAACTLTVERLDAARPAGTPAS